MAVFTITTPDHVLTIEKDEDIGDYFVQIEDTATETFMILNSWDLKEFSAAVGSALKLVETLNDE